MRGLSFGILEIANGLKFSFLVCSVSKASDADTSAFVPSRYGEGRDEGWWLVTVLSGVVASAEETPISRTWITELQKDTIGIFWPCWLLVIPLLLCALMKYNVNVKTSNVVF